MTESSPLNAVTQKAKRQLTERQLIDDNHHGDRYANWLLTFGKNPDRVEGYAKTTAQNHAYRTDRFYRGVWDGDGKYTIDLTTDHADRWSTELAYEDCGTG